MTLSVLYNARLLVLQAHFSQLALPISDYNTDLKSVLDQSIRILQAMIDICANSGWLTSSLTCMRLLQMVMQVLSWKITYSLSRSTSSEAERFYLIHFSLWLQGMWSDQDSSLWMIPCMNDDLLGSLTARGIHTLHQLLELPRETLKSVTGNFPASKLSQVPILSQIGHICSFFIDLSDSSLYFFWS